MSIASRYRAKFGADHHPQRPAAGPQPSPFSTAPSRGSHPTPSPFDGLSTTVVTPTAPSTTPNPFATVVTASALEPVPPPPAIFDTPPNPFALPVFSTPSLASEPQPPSDLSPQKPNTNPDSTNNNNNPFLGPSARKPNPFQSCPFGQESGITTTTTPANPFGGKTVTASSPSSSWSPHPSSGAGHGRAPGGFDRPVLTCYGCGAPGHKMSDCPERRHNDTFGGGWHRGPDMKYDRGPPPRDHDMYPRTSEEWGQNNEAVDPSGRHRPR